MAFDLSSISKTKRVRSPKIVVVGQGKIGKTTFAAMSPNAIGILTEDGADAVDANAFPLASSLVEVYAAIDTLINKDHDFQTLFIDSLDWLEPMIQEYVCKQNNWKNIEQPGFGKGYVAAAEEWWHCIKKRFASPQNAETRRADHFVATECDEVCVPCLNIGWHVGHCLACINNCYCTGLVGCCAQFCSGVNGAENIGHCSE